MCDISAPVIFCREFRLLTLTLTLSRNGLAAKITGANVLLRNNSNSTMKPASLKQHLANAHPSMMSKNRSFFESKLSSLKRQKLDQTGIFGALTKPLYMHYIPLLYLWQKLKSHITLVKPF